MYLSPVTLNPWLRLYRILALAVPILALPLGACDGSQSPTPPPEDGSEAIRSPVGQAARNKVDILFMVDNSLSMEAMARELRNRFGQFFTVFDDLVRSGTYADLHIGVVTSDYGAGLGSGICGNGGSGQQGLLQGIGADASVGCRGPLGNVNYISYDFAPTGANNLPAGQDLVQTFTCMASVGTQGCGFEHVLESVRAALLHPANGDFLRSDALLTVVFLTNEDDCSAPPDSDLFQSSPESDAQYGFRSNYRCTRFGLTCNGPLPADQAPSGSLTCAPSGLSSGGKLYDVQRYIDFFSKPRSQGGIKDRPASDVLLVGIDPIPEGSDGLTNPVQVLLSDPATPVGQPYSPARRSIPRPARPACPCSSTPARTSSNRRSSAIPPCA